MELTREERERITEKNEELLKSIEQNLQGWKDLSKYVKENKNDLADVVRLIKGRRGE